MAANDFWVIHPATNPIPFGKRQTQKPLLSLFH